MSRLCYSRSSTSGYAAEKHVHAALHRDRNTRKDGRIKLHHDVSEKQRQWFRFSMLKTTRYCQD